MRRILNLQHRRTTTGLPNKKRYSPLPSTAKHFAFDDHLSWLSPINPDCGSVTGDVQEEQPDPGGA